VHRALVDARRGPRRPLKPFARRGRLRRRWAKAIRVALALSLFGCNVALVHGGDAGDGGADAGDAGVVNGCTPSDFAANDHTSPGDLRLVSFPTTPSPAAYQPRCMRVKVGQKVTWLGDLASHPLTPHGASESSGASPIVPTSSGTSAAFTFTSEGVFGFACAHHPAQMLGAIDVVR